MEPKVSQWFSYSSFVKEVLIMMVPYMLWYVIDQTYIKRVYLEAEGLRLKV